MSKYDDILHMPHHVSTKHPPMSRENRAAQFGAFAALTGYDAAVRETARLTDNKIEQEEERIDALNRQLVALAAKLDESPIAAITYFEPDKRKSGGAYRTAEGTVRRIDGFDGVVELITSGGKTVIPMDNIVAIESDCLRMPDFDDIPPDEGQFD